MQDNDNDPEPTLVNVLNRFHINLVVQLEHYDPHLVIAHFDRMHLSYMAAL